MESVLLLALKGHTRAAHLRHSKRVVCLHSHHLLYPAALLLRMGLGTNDKGLELCIPARIYPQLLHHLVNAGNITWNGMKCSCPKICNELQLSLGISRSSRNCHHPKPLRTILESQSTCKHSVSRRVLEYIPRTQSHHMEASCNRIGPLIQIFLCMYDYRRISRSTAGRVQAHRLLKRYRCNPKGICITQILFGGKRYLLQVIQRLYIVGRQTVLLKSFFIERGIHAMPHGLL